MITKTTMSKSVECFCLFTLYLSQLTNAQSSGEAPPLNVPDTLSVCGNSLDPSISNGTHCRQLNQTVVQCYGTIGTTPIETVHITELILCSWPKHDFDPTEALYDFPSIRSLRIENSTNLSYFTNDFPLLTHLENINISWTKMSQLRPTMFSNLKALRFVDLRWNNIVHMSKPLLPMNFEGLYLAGNPWNCALNMWWLLNSTMNQHIYDRDNLKCNETNSPYNGRPVMMVMEYKRYLSKACANNTELKGCKCEVSYIRLDDDQITLTPMNSVNCSGRHLLRLPSVLPVNTTQLLANYNEITSIDPLTTTAYDFVQDVYLDYNFIASIETLETTLWFKSFRIFSLKGNKLTKIPVYAIENALLGKKHEPILNLSDNPWMCDCKFGTRFQKMLQRFRTNIRDSSNVTCKYIEGDSNFGHPVLKLRRTDFCKMPKEYKVQPLDLLNGVLGTLIILILSKLAYDYYHYRKSGRLPWIVSKLP